MGSTSSDSESDEREAKKAKKEKKAKKDKKEKKEKKEKKGKAKKDKKRKRSRSPSPSSSPERETPQQELARVRRACNKLRCILWEFPAIKKDLRGLLWTIDSGQGVNLEVVDDEKLRKLVSDLFANLRLKHVPPHIWSVGPGTQPTLRTVGHVFEEQITEKPPEDLPQPAKGAQKKGPAAPIVPAPVGGGGYQPALDGDDEEGRPEPADSDGGGAAVGPRPPAASDEEEEAPVAGPSLPPQAAGAAGDDPEAAAAAAAAARPRRVLGPAAPPPEVLAAAAELAEMLVGPPPPDLVEEDDGATPATREEAVKVLLKRVQTGANAYKMLGLDQKAAAGDIRKAYWKLSLLVHPDKCDHPGAADAFQALAAARDALSDPQKRAAVDEGILEEQWREEYEADLAFRRQQAEWRRIRGESLPEDEELLRPGGPGGGEGGGPQRDAWMTELPPERQARPGGVTVPVSQTAFSKRGVTGRGDTSGWTDTPQIAAERQQQLLLGNGSVETLTAAIQDREDRERRAQRIAAVDEYNARNRPKTLLEMHQEKLAQGVKKEKKKAGPAGPPQDQMPRPFDRDRDLAPPGKKVDVKTFTAGTGSLSSRFQGGAGSGNRHML